MILEEEVEQEDLENLLELLLVVILQVHWVLVFQLYQLQLKVIQ
tara:strand:- start:568 stop:699 length:132 start_codon:yes stop_codon:yes gene_type:complete